jgi:hypothetical protein
MRESLFDSPLYASGMQVWQLDDRRSAMNCGHARTIPNSLCSIGLGFRLSQKDHAPGG